jgi:23S rRNA pseudouridine1911/1915/1917 synthase
MKEKKIARARSQYTDYPVHESMELMDFLMAKMPDASRTKLKELLSKQIVFVNSTIVSQYNYPLKPGMLVQISRAKNGKKFYSSLFQIVYEDAYLIVVNKKEGIPAASIDKQKGGTVQSVLTRYLQRSGRQRRIFMVHRIDKETSGFMIYAKDEHTKKNLLDHWNEAVTDYRYVAIVNGELEKNFGTITSLLTMETKDPSPYNEGIESEKVETHYKTIKRANGYSMIELETGRKNLMREHMNKIGHPIIGDSKFFYDESPIDRLALHAFKLCFYHPVTGEIMQFETPYPSAFKRIMLRDNAPTQTE